MRTFNVAFSPFNGLKLIWPAKQLSKITYCTLVCLAVLGIQPAISHPHVWVNARAQVLFDDQGRVSAIEHKWSFDEAFSTYIIQGLDEDQDGVYSREELAPLAQTNVESLADFAFFTFMGVEEATVDFTDPRDYWLTYDKEKTSLTLHFTLPLEQPALVIGNLALEIYDPEYFVAFNLADEKAVQLASSAPSNCGLTVQKAADFDDAFAAALNEIPADQRELPDEMFQVTSKFSNTAIIHCK